MMSIKGRNSIFLRKMTGNNINPQLDLVNVNMHTKFGQILSIHFQDNLSGNKIMTSIKGRYSMGRNSI